MKKTFVSYLESIDMGTKLISKIKSYHDSFFAMYAEPILDIIVSEYVNADGQRQYVSVFFFSGEYVFEANNFLTDECHLWITKLANNIAYIGFTVKDFDFKSASPSSRLSLYANWIQGTDFNLDIKASGNNCMHLLEISRKYIKTSLS